MVSRKRYSYVPEIASSESEDSTDDQEYIAGGKQRKFSKLNQPKNGFHSQDGTQRSLSESNENNLQSSRRQRCYSRNALMARENRLKKKMYIEGLEGEVNKFKRDNKTLRSILDNQSHVITELRKEVRYLKSIVVNSSDLANLLKAVNYNTGMSVTASLDKSLTVKNNYVSKKNVAGGKTAHPWGEAEECERMKMSDSPSASQVSNADLGFMFDDPLLSDNIFEDIPLSEFKHPDHGDLPQNGTDNHVSSEVTLKEHNYTTVPYSDQNIDDVGICLHVSKHRVSLEFCSACSENASQTWLEVE